MTVAPDPAAAGYAAVAVHYRTLGWQGVLPVPAGQKWPPPSGYTGADGAWPSGPTVLQWTRQHPHHNVALRLPRGIVGIDVDAYGSKTGDQTLAALESEYGPLPPTWSSTSRGPGPSRILFYRCDPDLVLPGIVGPNVEIIQHHHRYAVVWPSIVEGRPYRWWTPAGTVADGPPRSQRAGQLPENWHHLRRPERPAIAADWQPRALDGRWSPAVTRQHADGVAALQSGSRHDSTLPVVLALARLDAQGHPGASEALDDLHGRFVAAIADRARPREAEAEWRRLEQGAYGRVAVTPSTRPSWDQLDRRPADDIITVPDIAALAAAQRNTVDAPESRPGPAQTPTIPESRPGPVDDPQAADDDQHTPPPHGWEPVDLGPILDGTHNPPRPTLLTIRPAP